MIPGAGFFGIFFLISLINLGLGIWAVVDAAVRPDSAWRAADQNKIVWILVALFIPVVGPIVYLSLIRPKVMQAGARRGPGEFPEPPARP